MSSWAKIAATGAKAVEVVEKAVEVVENIQAQMESLSVDHDDFSEAHSTDDAVKILWKIDTNRLSPGEDYKIDVQGYTHYHGDADYARRPLFDFVKPEVFERPTYKMFLDLLDNYTREIGKAEKVSFQERQEIQDFLDEIIKTRVMQYVRSYLINKGKCTSDPGAFKTLLYNLWFGMYKSTRDGGVDSCGFEHVFVGEEADHKNQITGCHGWIQLYNEEKNGRLDYHGYISMNRTRPSDEQHILTLQFTLLDEEDGSEDKKPMSTSFIGVSPEFEIGLYTLLALAPGPETKEERGKQVTKCDFGDHQAEINIVTWDWYGKTRIRTAYPEE
uniref:EndoU domain-containing protein n=1 Tax=Aplanochytrium stocchinoi TaxID=215587 RepID=A0A7S3PHP2_9STRA|mmetsp:Transcript_15852/g.19655  ORF Transcript_15852/g.19655 Transcript_15852/m.19655 type:complete len:330 (+) Transcript_15852:237-1226(+)|eukprot:CAMPEP_0204858442 /NCGR_PEP_ID=MMETSP1347-20130617/22517_1 /ASSEMBLY_ACC=CAM_ASM_000690 /TAXON_ID=215587 /ORGANISM="Aplanochytrium stocchinoi, Strain GSBS06" /LENGTH=329 /DNA_ID=CAMNT_0052006511 /DNA_START=174 /DNA_END=1163 /DNA_ORIENTATION=+